MAWEVTVHKKAVKGLRDCPKSVREDLEVLANEMRVGGPIRGNWASFGWLHQSQAYHCHLNYRYVACWRVDEQAKKIEVYYVGTRENAPY